ncbi:defensin-like protein 37 [Gossypium australe]|uniref:Defensin-like protein 37 n=1 Tax=Gossypium australe TaxID=47621 RepID=A0A5B6UXY1_9ROSI|nr:defensin-like protein 37 [Gossypium australe]
MASLPLKCYFLGLLCLVFFINIEKDSAGGKVWEAVMGTCSQFKDCNKYCITNGFPLGGFCKTLNPTAPPFCLCKYT